MYVLIKNRLATKYELECWYTLDEALKLWALHQMDEDIQTAMHKELEQKNPK